jgi:hypothetical protein
MVRDEPAGDLIVVIRATPLTVDAAIDDIAEAAAVSAEAYEVMAGDRREVLYGVSVFSAQDDIETLAILERFDAAESYLMAGSTCYEVSASQCSPPAPVPITSTCNS